MYIWHTLSSKVPLASEITSYSSYNIFFQSFWGYSWVYFMGVHTLILCPLTGKESFEEKKTLTEFYNGWPKLATNSHYISISKLFSVSFDQDHIDPLPESSIEFCILFDSDLIQKKFRDTDLDNSYHCIVWLIVCKVYTLCFLFILYTLLSCCCVAPRAF